MVRENFDPDTTVDREFTRKVARLVQQHTTSTDINIPAGIYAIEGSVISRIEENDGSDIEKVYNYRKGIHHLVKEYVNESPYLLSIGEKADAIMQLYTDRQRTTQETLDELKKIFAEIKAARDTQAERNIPVEEFSIFWLLKKTGFPEPEIKAHDMKQILNRYPHWRHSEQQARDVKQELYEVLLQSRTTDIKEVKRIIDQITNVLKRAAQ
jgi:type I restriction enzyme R subunit